ncbi:MAG: SGNH/GDSL hydrolase family protein [Sphingomonas sp.]|nr:SGNH/GDSL hydrolase family protein [Sphingomonas sp.]
MPAPTGSPVLATEGDSISVTWSGNHTGMYAAARSNVKHCGLAVGGSGIDNLNQRVSGVVNCNPKVLTVLIGANDMYSGTPGVTTQAWLDKLWIYTDAMRARGYKVAVGTILPQYNANAAYTAEFNRRRRDEANPGIRAAVGKHVDAVIDFAADPSMGPDSAAQDKSLYADGLHPTEGCGMGCGGQGKLLSVYMPVVDRLLGQ